MKLTRLLLWLMRFVEPLRGWRVPVELLRGRTGQDGASATLLIAGHLRRTAYFKARLFSAAPTTEKARLVPIWALQRLLDAWKSAADVTIVEIDHISARLFMKADWLTAPPWVSSVMPVPEDLQEFARHHGHAATDMRKVRNRPFAAALSHEPQDFDTFFDRFHMPYVAKRHGHTASLAPRWYWRRLFRQGGIHWITHEGRQVAADLVIMRQGMLHKLINGVLDGDVEWMKAGALAALYVHAIQLARKNACTSIHLGGSRATLHDGVLRYKCKWGGVICPFNEGYSKHFVTLYHWGSIEGGAERFLSHFSLIHHDGPGLSALWFAPPEVCRSAEYLTRECEALNALGLQCFRVVVRRPVPEGFQCPSGVRLVDWEEARATPPHTWSGMHGPP